MMQLVSAARFLPALESLSAGFAYVGMVLILAAFVLETRGRLRSRGSVYLALMSLGSALLALRAAQMGEWAFLILEVVWCLAAILAWLRPRSAV